MRVILDFEKNAVEKAKYRGKYRWQPPPLKPHLSDRGESGARPGMLGKLGQAFGLNKPIEIRKLGGQGYDLRSLSNAKRIELKVRKDKPEQFRGRMVDESGDLPAAYFNEYSSSLDCGQIVDSLAHALLHRNELYPPGRLNQTAERDSQNA